MKHLLSLFAMAIELLISVQAAPNPLPNFLFIFVDDLGWSGTSVPMIPGNDLSRNSGYRMPNLERLAAQGMIFSQAYAAHPKCECSRASLQMGRTTTSLNATDKRARNWNAPPADSLASNLKRANPAYRAAHFGKWQWPTPPESFGYDASDGITQNADGDSPDPDDPKQSFGITRRAQAYMEKQVREGRPFFLQLSYYAVHAKPQALASTVKKYEKAGNNQRGRGDQAVMAAMTEDHDTCVGQMMRKLNELGVANNTFIIYMGDNGMRSEALKGGKTSLDEGGIRVPLIVAGPGIGGGYCNEPAIGYDIFPTILDLAVPGYSLPKGVEGGSWKEVLLNRGAGKVQRPINRLVFHIDMEVEHPQTALRKDNLKLLYYWDTKESFLYDLSTDLGESHNLAGEKPAIAERLLSELKAHVRSGLGAEKFAALERGTMRSSNDPAGRQKGRESKGGGKKKGGGQRPANN